MRSALFLLAGTGCITALQVTRPASLDEKAVAPPFTLPAQDGTRVSLANTLANGPVALVFYRGHW